MEEKTEGKEVALGGFGVARVALGEDDAGDIKTPFKPIIFILVIIDHELLGYMHHHPMHTTNNAGPSCDVLKRP